MSDTYPIGEFEQLALLAVMRLGHGAYGASIQRELDERAGRSTAISTIYITLSRLESKGMVRSELRTPTEARGGRSRRYYMLEPGGIEALRNTRVRLLSMWEGLETELDHGFGSATDGS